MILIGGTLKIYEAIHVINFFFCMYKMYLISAEGYKNANVEFSTIKTTTEI